jgi:hypothetical protein
VTTAAKPLVALHAVTTEAASAQLAVSWCVEPGLADRVKEADFVEPRLLIITQSLERDRFDDYSSYVWADTQYQVVKLHRGMAHVTFRRPGRSRVVVLVVDVDDKASRADLRDLVRGGYHYGTTVWDDSVHGLQGVRTVGVRALSGVFATVEVEVDPNLFATEPSARRKWISDRVFGSTRFKDECQARKRTLVFGPILLPFFVVGTWLVRLASLPLIALLGFWRFPWRELKRPFSTTNSDWFDTGLFERNFIYQDGENDDRHPLVFIFSPHLLAVMPALAFGIFNVPVHYSGSKNRTHPLLDWGWWQAVFVVDGLYVALVLALVTVAVVTGAAGKVLDRLRPGAPEAVDWEELRRQLELVACGDHPASSITDLSLRQLTPRLVFNAAKAKVCKPFAS